MHVSDGLLPPSVCAGAYLVAGAATVLALRRSSDRDIPRMAVMTSVFFAASLVHFKIGATSVHLLLHGVVGAVVGPAAIVPIAVGLVLQALLFGHGGVTTIGVNAIIMGVPAMLAGMFVRGFVFKGNGGATRNAVVGFLAGSGATLLSLLLFAGFGLTAGPVFFTAFGVFVASHTPLVLLDGAVAAAAVGYLAKVKPEVFDASRSYTVDPAAGAA